MYQSLSNPNQQYMGKKPLNLSLSIFTEGYFNKIIYLVIAANIKVQIAD